MAESQTIGRDGVSGRRQIITPEGVPLDIRLADRGERAAAFVIDLLIIVAALVVLGILTVVMILGEDRPPGVLISFVMLAAFFLRVFYFTVFELRWRGTTPGKRLLRLRVIDREGGALGADAVVARNLTREVEIFLPLSLLWSPAHSPDGALIILGMLGWVSVLTLMPLFTRDRLRVGDMIAGTWVVAAPKTTLLPDLVAAPVEDQETAPAETPSYAFTDAQLDAYGIYELQVLEGILRRGHVEAAQSTLQEVCQRIAKKIDWPDPVPAGDARAFLDAYYAALRGRLERRMLLGRRRASKHDDPT